MSTPLEEGIKNISKASASIREGSPASPESSLTWCLTQLSKTSALVDIHSSGLEVTANKPITGGEKARDADKRLRAGQWRALVAIRTQHIKGGGRIARYQARGGLPPLLDLLKQPQSSRKVLDLALSILANCCTEKRTRLEVRKLDGVSVVVDVLKRNVSVETVQNRAARALGNLAMDPEGSADVHSAGGVPLLLLCLSVSPTPSSPSSLTPTPELCTPKLECAQSAARAFVYLSDTTENRLLLISQGTLQALALFIASEYPLCLRRACLRALHELTRGCSAECAREVSRSGALTDLGALALGEGGRPLEELALKTLANLCSQGCLRPLVGSLGVIQKFAEEVKNDPLKSGVFFKALCLCCREAVNRVKVKESGGLEVLIGFLSDHQNYTLTRFAFLACVDFVYDESALEQLQELGLVPLLIKRLVELAKGEELTTGKMDASLSSSSSCPELMTSCFDSFDFTPLEGNKREDMSKDQTSGSSSFLSLRSWLVSEGLISSEGELTECPSGTDVVCGSPQSSVSLSSLTPCSELSQTQTLRQPHSSLSTRYKPCQLSSSSSSTPVFFQATQLRNLPESPSSSHPYCTSTPQSEKLPSVTKTFFPPSSPTQISSPPRKRLRTSSTSSTSTCYNVVALDNPPVMSKTPTYHHPYHPEPWAPESPILLLLSRFSHASDPSTSLINTNVFSGLLYYLTQHHDPSGRCFRMLGRLSCNPNCLQDLVRTGAVALIRQRLCVRGEEIGNGKGRKRETGRQSKKVKAKIAQLGLDLLSNLRVQSESGFGSGVLTHIMLSGSETDKLYCVLSLPLINSNRVLLKKLLLDSGGLAAALQLIGCHRDNGNEDDEDGQSNKCKTCLAGWLHPLEQVSPFKLNFLYFSLLTGCLSSLLACSKEDRKNCGIDFATRMETPSSPMKTTQPQQKQSCPYQEATYDLTFLLDDGTLLLANQEAVAGEEGAKNVGSAYFRALLMGGFGEAQRARGEVIRIKDVNSGMLLPVLHYLHGCRLIERNENEDQGKESKQNANCLVLASLVSCGLGRPQDDLMPCYAEETEFWKTPLANVMIGAYMFLVPGLQRAAEDLCVGLLYSAVSSVLMTQAKPCFSDDNITTTGRMDVDLVCKDPTHSVPEGLPQLSKGRITEAQSTGQNVTSKCSKQQSKPPNSENSKQVRNVVPSDSTSLDNDTERAWLRSLLPQMYWFSQRYSYLRLGQVCLSVLLRPQRFRPFPLQSSLSTECFLLLVQEADCTEGLRQDILKLVKKALS
ncbi:armadillo repeat-containing protein 5-like isoform X1 [Xyrauchen texanus]|uniref:armadillo repeat-containing protein 5-like isoform X1 n=2 Tax=Xyrauchen texanus TaxID=154827 RepID=UPI002242967F|nr:armadillo repeat-containing protein 5-like isoform X1 [Xyrauchen texanus]XP_051988412.1 armadillo repeat-containing protein 5-like isoform X1 [Xyrauchen texanus]XP_051988413.1 armadillo repeat-containing protein 5-like isoform X1 [Xyrauchen texanus]